MKVMVMVKASPSCEAGQMPSEELLKEMTAFNESLVKAGVMLAGEGLRPSRSGKRITFHGSTQEVMDGPFAETKELVSGFWIWRVSSMEEALDWARKSPFQEGVLELRPISEAEDFGEALTPELQAREAALGFQQSMLSSQVTPYLFFGGRCEEALSFYQSALGARVGMVMRFDQSPDPVPEGMLAEGFESKIMHADFEIGSIRIMASDGCEPSSSFSGFRLALTVPDAETARGAFDALAEDGTVDMPLGPTFWSPCYGMVTDRFGVAWMVMVPGPEGH